MANEPQTAPASGQPTATPDHLGRLAHALHRTHPLAVSIHVGEDGYPVLDVTSHAGSAAVMAGSVHYWWGDGTGPIGPVGDTALVADRIAARCGAQEQVTSPTAPNQPRGAKSSSGLPGE